MPTVPSKGFIKASLAIVAAAPLVAISNVSHADIPITLAPAPGLFRETPVLAVWWQLTSSKGVVNTSLVPPHGMLDGLICRKVHSMCRAYIFLFSRIQTDMHVTT